MKKRRKELKKGGSFKIKARKAWNAVKDGILLVLLLSVLINKLSELSSASNVFVFVRESVAENANAQELPMQSLVVSVDKPEPKKYPAIVTSYNAEVSQTDGDPFTMANGKKVFEGAIASNCHPFGTKIEIVAVGEFVVSDRMNKRYTSSCGTENERIDIFRWNRSDNVTIKNAEYIVSESL